MTIYDLLSPSVFQTTAFQTTAFQTTSTYPFGVLDD